MTVDMFASVEPGPVFAEATDVISPCGCYRYRLNPKRWALGPVLLWLMLNPSKATATQPDPTMTRVVNFSRDAGYGACMIGNLYAWRSTDPKALRAAGDLAIGLENDTHIRRMLAECDAVVCAWGGSLPPGGLARADDVPAIVRAAGHDPLALRVTKGGQPSHPLYLPGALRPVPLASLLEAA